MVLSESSSNMVSTVKVYLQEQLQKCQKKEGKLYKYLSFKSLTPLTRAAYVVSLFYLLIYFNALPEVSNLVVTFGKLRRPQSNVKWLNKESQQQEHHHLYPPDAKEPMSLIKLSSASTQAIASIGSYCLANMAMTVTNKYVFSVCSPRIVCYSKLILFFLGCGI